MDKQRKLVKWIVIFFAAMLVFTFLSRAADSLNVANVDTKKMQNQVIAHNVKGTGKVEGTKEQAVFVLAGQKVEQVFAKEGQNVKKGETLFVLNQGALQEAIEKKQMEIETAVRKTEDLKSADSVKGQKKETEKARAQQNYNDAIKYGDINMANARMEVDAAKQKLQNFYNERAQAQSTAPQGDDSLSDGTGDHLESGEIQENTQGGNAADAYTKEQETALQEEIRAKEEALNQAIIARNNEVREAERAVQDADMAEATDGSLENAEAELSALQKEFGKLQALLEAKGEVKAPADGVIKSMSASTGSQTTEEASVILYETGGSLRMTGTIYKDDLKYVEIGGKASVKGSSGTEIPEAQIESISEAEEDKDSRRISILLPENTLSVGETAEFSITREEGPFTTCVPLSALREENGRSFVYVTDTENTILGEQLVARKVEVTVRDKNNSYAALEEGSLSSDQQIIISTDREVTEGSPVRLQES